MELRHIRYFLAVAEEMNFTRAAERLHIAQPPLSRQIQALEEELGTELFQRSPRALHLTEEGLLFKEQAKQILGLVDKATEEVREAKRGVSGTLYLGSVEGHAPRLISKWIAGFQKQYPHVQYHIWNGNSDDVCDRLMGGLCDLALIMEPYNAEGLNALSVYHEPWVAILPAEHPLAKGRGNTVTLADLSGQELILPSRKSRVHEILSWFDDAGLARPVIRCEMAHMMNVYALTEENIGIAIFPASAAEVLSNRKIIIKQIVKPAFTASYVLIWNKNRQPNGLAEHFLNYVRTLEQEQTAQIDEMKKG